MKDISLQYWGICTAGSLQVLIWRAARVTLCSCLFRVSVTFWKWKLSTPEPRWTNLRYKSRSQPWKKSQLQILHFFFFFFTPVVSQKHSLPPGSKRLEIECWKMQDCKEGSLVWSYQATANAIDRVQIKDNSISNLLTSIICCNTEALTLWIEDIFIVLHKKKV